MHDWEPQRHATWLELFFDLVFVVAVARLAELFHHHPEPRGALEFVGLFIPIWWAWISFSYFADLFDDDDSFDRLCQLGAMLGAAVLAVTLSDGVGDDGRVFAGTYGVMFLLLAAMYSFAGRRQPQFSGFCRWYVAGSLVGAGIWFLSMVLPTPARYVAWGVALVCNAAISGPLAYRYAREVPHQVSHMPERFGLFTIVVLGEAVLGVVVSMDAYGGDPAATVAAVAGFAMAAAVWWTYFNKFDEAAIDRAIAAGSGAQVRSFAYGYGHLVVYGAIAACGVGVQLSAERAVDGRTGAAVLGWSVAALVLGLTVIDWGVRRIVPMSVFGARALTGGASVVLSSAAISPALTSCAIALLWVFLAVVEALQNERYESNADAM